ncbi:hypothetical protein LCGC14_1191230 [marine sediment metagenome]|uniref:Uncharacterized protein n=1 Tax=marine sediment metagenome TaxID=412755 RepID=A0A0F9M745_9ZZZZ
MKERDVHKLIAESGGICNFPECGEKFIFQFEDGTFVKLYECAHIIGESPEGPRGNQTKSKLMAQDPENIILLCLKHHKIVDKNEKGYPVEKLKKIKENHIQWVNERLESLKETTWTLIIHSGNVTGTGVPNFDEELIYRDFYGTHIIVETEEIIIEEFLTKTQNWLVHIYLLHLFPLEKYGIDNFVHSCLDCVFLQFLQLYYSKGEVLNRVIFLLHLLHNEYHMRFVQYSFFVLL